MAILRYSMRERMKKVEKELRELEERNGALLFVSYRILLIKHRRF